MLVEHLPDDAATRLAVVPDSERGFLLQHDLQMASLDEARMQGWLTRRAMGVENEPLPERLKRPRDIRPVEPVDQAALARVLAHHGIQPRQEPQHN